ncbi:ferritin-like-domain-containing protein [Rhizoctonia solani]|nr:ferritin-like-domain-containing protein [Rhizoctonia solani]
MSHHLGAQTQPIYKAPTGPPGKWTLSGMRQHLQTAVLLELYTIPLYLFAAYSIKRDPGTTGTPEADAQDTMLEIVVQEMFHLGLAGNLLTAMRGRPQVYGEAFTPKYPSEILYEGVLMTLAPAKKSQVENFAEVEQPLPHRVDITQDEASTRTLGQYESIGQFYESLKAGLQSLHDNLGDDIFDKDSAGRQWKGREGTPLTPITDLETALDKLELIIEQGEGGPKEPKGKSHFDEFTRLSQYDLAVYPLASNPKTSQFKDREDTYPVMLAFDAAYSYLLWTLEAGWTYGGPDEEKKKKLRGNLHTLMVDVVGPIARFLVTQKLQTFNKNAAPPFNLHIFGADASPLEELKTLVGDAAKKYPQSPELKGAVTSVAGLFDLGNV